MADPEAEAASLLGKATTRIVYDLDRYQRAGQPPFATTLARETHFHDLGGDQSKIQISFSYSDGFMREIQKKVQAEPGDAPQRQEVVPLATSDVRPGNRVRDAQGGLVPGTHGAAGSVPAARCSTIRASRSGSISPSSARRISLSPSGR